MGYWLNLAATFGVFSAVVYHARRTDIPCRNAACIAQWLAWVTVHMAIAIPMLMILGMQLTTGRAASPMFIILKFALVVLLLAPWTIDKEVRA